MFRSKSSHFTVGSTAVLVLLTQIGELHSMHFKRCQIVVGFDLCLIDNALNDSPKFIPLITIGKKVSAVSFPTLMLFYEYLTPLSGHDAER